MQELFDHLVEDKELTEIDTKKILRTAGAIGLAGGAVLGLGKLASAPPADSTKQPQRVVRTANLHKEYDELSG